MTVKTDLWEDQAKLSSAQRKEPSNPSNFREKLEWTWMKRADITGKRVRAGNTSKRKSLWAGVCACGM